MSPENPLKSYLMHRERLISRLEAESPGLTKKLNDPREQKAHSKKVGNIQSHTGKGLIESSDNEKDLRLTRKTYSTDLIVRDGEFVERVQGDGYHRPNYTAKDLVKRTEGNLTFWGPEAVKEHSALLNRHQALSEIRSKNPQFLKDVELVYHPGWGAFLKESGYQTGTSTKLNDAEDETLISSNAKRKIRIAAKLIGKKDKEVKDARDALAAKHPNLKEQVAFVSSNKVDEHFDSNGKPLRLKGVYDELTPDQLKDEMERLDRVLGGQAIQEVEATHSLLTSSEFVTASELGERDPNIWKKRGFLEKYVALVPENLRNKTNLETFTNIYASTRREGNWSEPRTERYEVGTIKTMDGLCEAIVAIDSSDIKGSSELSQVLRKARYAGRTYEENPFFKALNENLKPEMRRLARGFNSGKYNRAPSGDSLKNAIGHLISGGTILTKWQGFLGFRPLISGEVERFTIPEQVRTKLERDDQLKDFEEVMHEFEEVVNETLIDFYKIEGPTDEEKEEMRSILAISS